MKMQKMSVRWSHASMIFLLLNCSIRGYLRSGWKISICAWNSKALEKTKLLERHLHFSVKNEYGVVWSHFMTQHLKRTWHEQTIWYNLQTELLAAELLLGILERSYLPVFVDEGHSERKQCVANVFHQHDKTWLCSVHGGSPSVRSERSWFDERLFHPTKSCFFPVINCVCCCFQSFAH